MWPNIIQLFRCLLSSLTPDQPLRVETGHNSWWESDDPMRPLENIEWSNKKRGFSAETIQQPLIKVQKFYAQDIQQEDCYIIA
jgi:hypothetical protein